MPCFDCVHHDFLRCFFVVTIFQSGHAAGTSPDKTRGHLFSVGFARHPQDQSGVCCTCHSLAPQINCPLARLSPETKMNYTIARFGTEDKRRGGRWLSDYIYTRRRQHLPKIRTLFCPVHSKKRSFLTSCVFLGQAGIPVTKGQRESSHTLENVPYKPTNCPVT